MRWLNLLFVLLLLNVGTATAGVHSNALGQCLVKATSVDDRNKLIVWMFTAAAQHPAVKSMAAVNEHQLNKANKDFADLTMKLLTKDCKAEAKRTVQAEGLQSLQNSFKVFGEVAGQELFTSPYVANAMADYVGHLNVVQLGLALMQ
jgi:hypothetical protein